MKVLAFAASNSSNSINQKLVTYVANLIDGADVEILNIHEYEMPIFSEDREKKLGQPKLAKQFFNKLGEADSIIISFAEHNGSYTAAYKNLFDWTSRIDGKVYQNKPMMLLATSPGARGAKTVLNSAVESAPHFGADVRASISVPSFYDNFDLKAGKISNHEIEEQIKQAITKL